MAILQSLLSKYKPTEADQPTRTSSDPVQNRRQKFVSALQDQLALLSGTTTKRAKRRRKQDDGSHANVETDVKIKSWLTKNSTVFTPKYGNEMLEFEKGRCALSVTAKTAPEVIKQLIDATNAGELDQHLAKAAAARKRPDKKSKKGAMTVVSKTA